MSDDTRLHVASERRQGFESLSFALAAESISDSAQSAEVDIRFDALQRIFTRALRKAARDWNHAHDGLGLLPLGLVGMCWSLLTRSDILQLALVCSSWRNLSRGLPSLWTSLSVCGTTRDLDAILSLSGQLPFELAISVFTLPDLVYIDDCLSKHAMRLRGLRVFEDEEGYLDAPEEVALFRYAAPILEKLSLDIRMNADCFYIPQQLFDGCAPKLRSVTLQDAFFPTSCPAFGGVTELEINWQPSGFARIGIENLFAVVPRVEKMQLLNRAALRGLPKIPSPSRLSQAVLICDGLSFDKLLDRGYLGIPRLFVRVQLVGMILNAALHYYPPSFKAKLSISHTQEISVDLRGADGSWATFFTRGQRADFVRELLYDVSIVQTLEHLILPATIAQLEPDAYGVAHYPYIANNVLVLPALRTLGIAHGPQGVRSVYDRGVLFGIVVAPLLSRIEIVRDDDYYDAIEPIDPSLLAAFIEAHIKCLDPSGLELSIGERDDIFFNEEDEEGMERLRRCVGTLTIW
ncbi:hypothetical protein AURDEDRAFT_161724 [Auricularia subglabra TFB-10046 SS5]|nr:hypothetical protein AURDEDRAFT_161724 [Auricularia subglabra TFB-10046 SS5]